VDGSNGTTGLTQSRAAFDPAAPVSLPLLALGVLVVLALGYRYYGAFIARQYALDDATTTPATRVNDGVDFVPTRPFYLLGQHFSAIAAAGPIAGPIMAAQTFGWLPCLLWILGGVVFIGAVHDFSTLVASVRHDARSIADVVKAHLGAKAGIAMMVFIWVALVYVIVAFTDVTASTFVSGDKDLAGLTFAFNPGGAVALSSALYLLLAVVMGLVERYVKPPLWLQTVIFVPLTLVAVWAGMTFSSVLKLDAIAGIPPGAIWAILILGYCFFASLIPVWILLQPRGYLGGFVLYMALAIGVIGLFFGGFPIQADAFRGFDLRETAGAGGLLFPFLFVTIACGACSGFHGLVCSGTTSKQIAAESHCKPIGFGAMLLEGFVAVIALGTIMIATSAEVKGLGAGAVYGNGLGKFLTVIIGDDPVRLAFAVTFGAMAFSTFVFDTLDVSTRLGRYILQEVFDWRGRVADITATALTCGVPLVFVLLAGPGAYRSFWALFGTSNQLLAALSLMGISVWLKKSGRRYWYTFVPMCFVSAVTITALLLQARSAITGEKWIDVVNGLVCIVLLALAGSLFYLGGKALLAPETPPPSPAIPTAA